MLDGPVLVTGAVGNVGAATIVALQAAGIAVRGGHLGVEAVAQRFPEIEPVRLDFLDDTTFVPALRGCSALFLLRPPPISTMKPTLNRLIDVAADLGVGHVVFSSVAGADTNRIVPHHRVETHLRASGLSWTILRPGFFAQNFGDAYRLDITEGNRVYVPAGDGRVAFVDVRDLGEVAATVFQHPDDHAGVGYTLTGPQAVTFTEAAAALTEVVGRTIRYEPATIPGYFGHLRRRSLPVVQAVVQTVLHAGLRRGDAETVDLTVDRLLGRPARPIDVYFRDHADLWT